MRVALAPGVSLSSRITPGSEERGRAAGPSRAMAFARGAFARGARALIRVPLASTPALRGAPPLTRAGFSSAAARAWDPDGRFASAGRDSRASSSSSTAASFPVPFSSRPAAARAASSSAPSSVGKLVIVESPAKATKVQTYLGPGYTVVASYGHVRDLVEKSGSVVPEEDFAMRWAERARDGVVRELISSAKRADAIILATDPDREGEANARYLQRTDFQLKEKGKVAKDKAAQDLRLANGKTQEANKLLALEKEEKEALEKSCSLATEELEREKKLTPLVVSFFNLLLTGPLTIYLI